MQSLLEEMQALQVPVCPENYAQLRLGGHQSTNLGGSYFSDVQLRRNDHDGMVLKFIDRNYKDDFLREVRTLATVRGIEGLQQLEAVLVEGMRYAIVSRYAGATLYECVRLLSCDQLEDVLQQLRAALERMHGAGVAHRNLHGRNVCVLFEERVRAEIIDFGGACFQAESSFEEAKRIDLDKFARLAEGARKLFSWSSSPEELTWLAHADEAEHDKEDDEDAFSGWVTESWEQSQNTKAPEGMGARKLSSWSSSPEELTWQAHADEAEHDKEDDEDAFSGWGTESWEQSQNTKAPEDMSEDEVLFWQLVGVIKRMNCDSDDESHDAHQGAKRQRRQ